MRSQVVILALLAFLGTLPADISTAEVEGKNDLQESLLEEDILDGQFWADPDFDRKRKPGRKPGKKLKKKPGKKPGKKTITLKSMDSNECPGHMCAEGTIGSGGCCPKKNWICCSDGLLCALEKKYCPPDLGLSIKDPVPTEAWLTQCEDLMKSENVFDNFAVAVSHGIHSLTLQDIRAFFNKEAQIANGIPTANRNLEAQADEIILPNAPDIPRLFNSIGMHTLDFALQNMDRPNYMMKTGILGRLSHVYHMQEFWTAAQPYYQQYQESGVDYSNVCACALETKGNGIHQGLINTFIHFKALHFNYMRAVSAECIFFSCYGSKIQAAGDPIPKLTSSDAWNIWRKYIDESRQGDENIKKFAFFLHCALA